MRKYRIIQKIRIENRKKEVYFYIERKKLWGWREIVNKEDIREKSLHFNDYSIAENYLTENYLSGWGYTLIDNNIYKFHPYSYCI